MKKVVLDDKQYTIYHKSLYTRLFYNARVRSYNHIIVEILSIQVQYLFHMVRYLWGMHDLPITIHVDINNIMKLWVDGSHVFYTSFR